jgi:hypothetical protein
VLLFCFGVLALCVHFVIGNLLAFLCLFGITDTRLFFSDLPADTWQLHDSCVSGLLRPAREALNSRSASAKVSSNSFTSTLCGYLRSNHSFVKDVKQDRRRKSLSNASVEAARKEKNCLKKVSCWRRIRGIFIKRDIRGIFCIKRDIRGIFMGQSGPILVCRESMSRHRGTRMQLSRNGPTCTTFIIL